MSISAFLPVYNEEKRIENALRSLQWCDEIIVLDKNSQDRTCEIATKFGAKVVKMENSSIYSASEFSRIKEYCSSEWVIIFTASDLIHPKLAHDIKKWTGQPDFNYNIISIPFRRYVLGLESERSPWYSSTYPAVFKKEDIIINNKIVHGAISVTNPKPYIMNNHNTHCMYHLTHETVDGMMERHLRYWRAEAINNSDNLSSSFLQIIKSIYVVIFKKRTFLMGWDGIALSMAYISYSLLLFIYKWEMKRSGMSEKYMNIRNNIKAEWEKT